MKRKKLAIICATSWCVLLLGILFAVAEFDIDDLMAFHRRMMSWCEFFPIGIAISRLSLWAGIAWAVLVWIVSIFVTLPATLALIGSYVAPIPVDRPD